MAELLSAITSVVLTWIGLGLVFIGLGLAGGRVAGLRVQEGEDLLTSFWLGWAFTLLFLQLWHLHFPVDGRALGLLSGMGAATLLWNWKTLKGLLKGGFPGNLLFFGLLFLTAIWVAIHAISRPLVLDSGLYHLSSVAWATSYPIVPGLGNLHGRLAFNSSYFLYVAMLEVGPWVGKSQHLAGGLLMLALFAQIFANAFKMLAAKGKGTRVCWLFNLMLLAPAVHMAASDYIASPSPDLPVFVLGLVLASGLLHYLSEPQARNGDNTIIFLTIVACTGITVKLSFLYLGVATLMVAGAVWLMDMRRKGEGAGWRIFLLGCLSAGAILVPWIARGVILSGYLAYPATVGAFSVDWLIPHEKAVEEAKWILSWARARGVDHKIILSGWDWFKPWFWYMLSRPSLRFAIAVPVLLAAGFSLAGVCGRLTGRVSWQTQGRSWMILPPPVAAIGLWFATAPDPRFAGASFWVLATGVMALTLDGFQALKTARSIGLVFLLSLGLVAIPLSRDAFPHLADNWGFRPIPRIELDVFVTNSGLVVYIPKDKDQCCFDAPLPCTPRPDADLCLRKEGDMSRGFRLTRNPKAP